MTTAKNFNGLGSSIETSKAACGWLCRALRIVGPAVALFNPIVGALITGAAYVIYEKGTLPPVDYDALPMNGIEEAILNKWVGTNLKLSKNKEADANKVLVKIQAIKAFVKLAETKANILSSNALINRSRLVGILLSQLEKIVDSTMVGFSKQTNAFPLSTINLLPLDFATSKLTDTVSYQGFSMANQGGGAIDENYGENPQTKTDNSLRNGILVIGGIITLGWLLKSKKSKN